MDLSIDGKKQCSKCGLSKHVEYFHRDKGTKSGRQSYCMACKRDSDALRYYTKRMEMFKDEIEKVYNRFLKSDELMLSREDLGNQFRFFWSAK